MNCCIDNLETVEVLEIRALPAGVRIAITKLKAICLKYLAHLALPDHSLCFVVRVSNHEIAPTCCTIFAFDRILVVRQHASSSRPRS